MGDSLEASIALEGRCRLFNETYSLSCVGEEPLLFNLHGFDHLAQRRVLAEDIFQG